MNFNKIKDAVIAITYKCNSRCRMCNIWQDKNLEELNPDVFFKLPKNLKSINITGGEPFLHNNLPLIVKNIVKHCPKSDIIISTNGFATDLILQQVKGILEIKPDIGIAVSLDGIGKKHNEIRGVKNGYGKVLATLKGLKEIGVKSLKVSFTLGDYNIAELKKVYKFAEEWRLEFSLALVHSGKNYFNKENEIINKQKMEEELRWLIGKELEGWDLKKWGRAYFTQGIIAFLRKGKRILLDYSGKENIFIDTDANVYPNNVTDKAMGKIGDRNFIKIKSKESWMMCTARQAIKKHCIRVVLWIVSEKFKNSLQNKKS